MYERIRFNSFMHTLRWRQGEHVMFAADTQCGKTTLASYLVSRRSSVTVVATKPKDRNLAQRYADYHRYSQWPPVKDDHRVLLWPKKQRTMRDDIAVQQEVVGKALNSIANEGGWCVVIDETHWTSQFLKLDREVAVLHHQGASAGITMVTLTQRPAWIPRIIYTSATHAFIGRATLPDDLRALSAMGGPHAVGIKDALPRLGPHDLLYFNPRSEAEPVVVNIRY